MRDGLSERAHSEMQDPDWPPVGTCAACGTIPGKSHGWPCKPLEATA